MATRIFSPTRSIHWHEFVLGTIIGGVLFGAGWQIGARLVDRYIFHRHRYHMGFKSKDQPNGPRTGLGGQNTIDHPLSTRYWDVIPTAPHPHKDTSSDSMDPNFVIGHNTIGHANQPDWEHSYGQPV